MAMPAVEDLLRDDNLLIKVNLILGKGFVDICLHSGKPCWRLGFLTSPVLHFKERYHFGFRGFPEGNNSEHDVRSGNMAFQNTSGL